MASRLAFRILRRLDRFLPFCLLLGFLPFFLVFLGRDPGVFLTAWVTFSIIAMATECVFTGISDRIREWRQKRRLTYDELEGLERDGQTKFRELRTAIMDQPNGSGVILDLIEDIEGFSHQMRPGLDWRLRTHSSLWAIAAYGISAAVSFNILDAQAPGFYALPWYLRGACFAPAIFFWEYTWGWAIEKLIGVCPWRYTRSLTKWRRYIRLHYAGFWFGFGFVLEWTHRQLVPLIISSFNVLPGK